MLNIFKIAKLNAEPILAAYNKELSSATSGDACSVRNFATWVEGNAQLALNAKLPVMVGLINGKPYFNIYERIDELAQLCGRSREELLREQLNTFYEKRTNFDTAFVDGEKFRYGMLNGGGAGLPLYGLYCIILDWSVLESEENIAYLPGDSLSICLKTDNSFDQTLLEQHATPHSRRHLMAAKERWTDILSSTSHQWPNLLVGSKDKYFEAIFIGNITLSKIKCVRIAKTEYDRLWDMAFTNLGKRLSNAARAEVDDFIQFQKCVKDGLITEEVLA